MKFTLLIAPIYFLISSFKKKEMKATVYFKNGYPVANTEIEMRSFLQGNSRKSKSSKIVATTNADGSHYFSFKSKRRYMYRLVRVSDSGRGIPPEVEHRKVNYFDIYLQ